MNNSELLEIAEEYGTPTFVFDVREFWQRLDKIADIFGEDVRLCFAMKANPFLAAAAADHGERLEVCSPGELAICEDVEGVEEALVDQRGAVLVVDVFLNVLEQVDDGLKRDVVH